MHELSIASAAVEKAERTARDHGATAVEAVVLRIGELAGVVPDALRFSFGLVTEGTLLDGAELIVEEVRARAWCESCEDAFGVGSPPALLCPRCGRAAERVLSGRELELVAVSLPDSPVCPAEPGEPGTERTTDVPQC
ncbi:hydrogenase maturation nickel metallochaperone HypA [Streptomyces sp. NPDC004609]|uniref:hydrogenase maturation nickel metallochaperone HypA n=1 Tax=Streptomyces sp. NPDC004609 TaxID=3364704 RepID=UPI00369633B8